MSLALQSKSCDQQFENTTDAEFLKLRPLLTPCGITRYYTNKAGVYQRHLPLTQHTGGKLTMQKIERKHLTCGHTSNA